MRGSPRFGGERNYRRNTITLAPFSNSSRKEEKEEGVFFSLEFPARFIKTFNFVYYAFVTLI